MRRTVLALARINLRVRRAFIRPEKFEVRDRSRVLVIVYGLAAALAATALVIVTAVSIQSVADAAADPSAPVGAFLPCQILFVPAVHLLLCR